MFDLQAFGFFQTLSTDLIQLVLSQPYNYSCNDYIIKLKYLKFKEPDKTITRLVAQRTCKGYILATFYILST